MSSDASGTPRASRQRDLISMAWQQVRMAEPAPPGSSTAAPKDRSPAAPTREIPGYRMIGEVQRGGQGVVYKAVQLSTNRTVAIKVMRHGPFAGARDRLRFDREVQILAQLHHPNIVTIHDSGEIEGFAYFVMNLVDGPPLDQYAAGARLEPRALLGLFARICEAVNVAHLRGVIHRDLKPSNVRVDREGSPHILDFGLAKVSREPALLDNSSDLTTVTTHFVGSLPWASPEQIEGRWEQVDTRTDVYALGVMLYQLVTGHYPYDTSGNVRELLNRITTAEPIHPRTFRRDLSDEVATIILQCLHKDPERRYQTAGELARDVRRYTAGEPIEAKRDSLWYVISKQLARHRLAAYGALGLVAVVTIGFVVSLVFWSQAAAARQEAEYQAGLAHRNAEQASEQAARAAREAARATAVSAFLEDMFASANPADGGARTITVAEALDRAVATLDAGRLVGEPGVEAAVRSAIGKTYAGLGLLAEGAVQVARARALLEQTDAVDSERLQAQVDHAAILRAQEETADAEALLREVLAAEPWPEVRAYALNELGCLLRDRGELAEAQELIETALEMRRAQHGRQHEDVVRSLNDLALVRQEQGHLKEAANAMRETLEIAESLPGSRRSSLAVHTNNLASILQRLGEFDEAEALYKRAIEVMREVYGSEHARVATCLSGLAAMYQKQARLDEAEALLAEALEIRRNTVGTEHGAYADTLNNLAVVQYHRGDIAAAAEMLNEVAEIMQRTRGRDHTDTLTVLGNLAAIERMRGRPERAADLLGEVLDRRLEHVDAQHPEVLATQRNLAVCLMELERYGEAEPLLRAALEGQRAVLGEGHARVADTLESLGRALLEQDRYDESERLLRESLDVRRAALGDDHPMVAQSLDALGTLLRQTERAAEAAEMLREAAGIAKQRQGDTHWQTEVYRANLAACLTTLEQYEEAEVLLLRSYDALVAEFGAAHKYARKLAGNAVTLYEGWGRPDVAEAWRARQAAEAP